jgi:hypothetical protein
MHARFRPLFLVFLVCGAQQAAGSDSEVQLPLPPALAESLAWRQDSESVLRAFRVPRRLPGAPAATAVRTAGLRAAADHGPRLTRRSTRTLADVPIAVDPALVETQPSLAASPRRQDALVVTYVAAAYPDPPGTRCFVARSLDRGRTWKAPVRLPVLAPTNTCADPTVAYSQDGGHLYAAYRNTRTTSGFLPEDPTGRLFRIESQTDIVVVHSRDDGNTWSSPVIALAAQPSSVTYTCNPYPACALLDWTSGSSFERPSLAVGGSSFERPSLAVGGRGWCVEAVHVAATRLADLDDEAPPTTIVVTRSRNLGRDWSAPLTLDSGQPAGPRVITQGPRVVTTQGRDVLVAWYHSGFDGWLAGDFEIRTSRSGDAGASWGPIVAAATDGSETPFTLGAPLGTRPLYKKWWTTMFPDAVIDRDGRAHIVYAHDPEVGSATAEEGDIRYVTSARAPYGEWSEPVTVNDDGPGRAQGFASLAARRHGRTTAVEAVWEDTRLAPDLPPGVPQAQLSLYDIFHARLELGRGATWSANVRVTDTSSTQSQTSAAGRTSVAANDSGVIFAAWIDRRAAVSPSDAASDVYGSRIDPR